MKRLIAFILCILFATLLCACETDSQTTEPTQAQTDANNENVSDGKYAGLPIVGTWMCDNINKDCYFIFEENGDAFAKWGTTTVYGYFDYYEDEDMYDIDIPNFLYNEYKLTVDGTSIRLQSEQSGYTFKKATMPDITIKAPDNLDAGEKLFGRWQCADLFECYEFRDDNTVTITDLYNYTTIECKYTCSDNKITFYYMSSATKDGSRELEYSFVDNKLELGGSIYENVTGMN